MRTEEYFIIPTDKTSICYVFFPLKASFFRCNTALTNEIVAYVNYGKCNNEALQQQLEYILSKPKLPIHHNNNAFPKYACFLVSEKCNLACTYCYAHDSHSHVELSKENLKKYIDYMFSFREKQRGISFLGGGEPLLSWDLIEYAINYAQDKANNYNENIRFGITTNLTILSQKIIDFIKLNKININVSFDILPEVQDKQRIFPDGRGTFNIVDSNIKLLILNGIIPRIRATITSINVTKMPEMVQFIIDNYPQVQTIHLEHVSDVEFTSNDDYISKFVKYYFVALKLAKKSNKRLTNSAISSLRTLKDTFCSKEFCVTAYNDIVSCHRVSNCEDYSSNPFKYGELVNNKIELNNNLSCDFSTQLDDCKTCFARYNCAGGCRYNRFVLSKEAFKNYCSFIRKMLVGFFDFLSDNNEE